MNIDKSAMKFIKKNAVASIASDGLVGNMIVNITQILKMLRLQNLETF